MLWSATVPTDYFHLVIAMRLGYILKKLPVFLQYLCGHILQVFACLKYNAEQSMVCFALGSNKSTWIKWNSCTHSIILICTVWLFSWLYMHNILIIFIDRLTKEDFSALIVTGFQNHS